MSDSKYNFDSEKSDYLTPPEIIENILERINQRKFFVDVCCSIANIPAYAHFIDGQYDGLNMPWKLEHDYSVSGWAYCNPPFEQCGKWVKKAHEEQLRGNRSVLLIPARTETKFWHDYILDKDGFSFRPGVSVQFLRKGVCFLDSKTGEPVQMKQAVKGIFDDDGNQVYKFVDGIYKNPLAIVYFDNIKESINQKRIRLGLKPLTEEEAL